MTRVSKTKAEHKDNVSLRLEPFGVSVLLSIPAAAQDSFLKLHKRYLPELDITSAEGIKPDISVTFVTGKATSVQASGRDIKVVITESASPEQIAYDSSILISHLLEKKLNQKGIFSMNCSSVAYGGNSVALLGDSGSGKTTSALYIGLSNKDIKIISGKRVYLNTKFEIMDSVPTLPISTESVSSEFTGFGLNTSKLLNMLRLGTKIAPEPENFGLLRNTEYPSKLKALVFVNKYEGTLQHSEVKTYGDKEYAKTYAAFGDGGGVLVSNKLPIPFVFSIEDRTRRAEFVRQLLESTKVVHLRGRLNEISEYVSQYLKE